MRIMCLNGWGGKLYGELQSYLIEARPHILCLQEVVHSPMSEKAWLTYKDGDHILQQRAQFFHDVCEALPDHQAVFCPAAQGILWDGNEAVLSQWGLATFVHRAMPIVGQIQGFVHKDFSPDGYGKHPRSRSAHGVRVYDYEGNRFISVTHMHGLRDLRGKMDTPERYAQVQKLLEMSQYLAEADDLRVICGDFNVEADSETLSILTRTGMTELVTSGDFDGTRTSHYTKAGRYADYMLINRPEAVENFDVVAVPEVSDHRPLLLDLF